MLFELFAVLLMALVYSPTGLACELHIICLCSQCILVNVTQFVVKNLCGLINEFGALSISICNLFNTIHAQN